MAALVYVIELFLTSTCGPIEQLYRHDVWDDFVTGARDEKYRRRNLVNAFQIVPFKSADPRENATKAGYYRSVYGLNICKGALKHQVLKQVT